ncbi:MAG TPA: hypothetical protein VFB74_36035 [Kribbellaceae bacterium]|nr:hypothetical protein [Kribbellaceae bacterium]
MAAADTVESWAAGTCPNGKHDWPFCIVGGSDGAIKLADEPGRLDDKYVTLTQLQATRSTGSKRNSPTLSGSL